MTTAPGEIGDVWTLTARDEGSLRDISGAIHDAYVDGAVTFDRRTGVVVVPIAQEGWAGGPTAESRPIRRTWRFIEHHVAFHRGWLTIRRVSALHGLKDWDAPIIEGGGFQRASGEIRVYADGALRAKVEAVDVTLDISSDVIGHVRRRIGTFTRVQSDVWLEHRRPDA